MPSAQMKNIVSDRNSTKKEKPDMSQASWRKRLAVWKSRLYLYPLPEPMPHTRRFWVATGVVAVLGTIFAAYFIKYLFAQQDAFVSPAEDLGIMSQAIWSVTHGLLLHQSICNIVSDTNCAGLQGYSRFAIHVEPILFPISLLYALWPTPKLLMVVQTVVVASGVFPAFWLARLRLRSELAGVLVAVLYLLYPELQQAEAFYFHAVTMTAALLLFTLYFMYTRRTVWVFVFALLSMACKEEIPLVIAMFGLWSMLFQQRWKVGLGLVGMAFVWLGMVLLMFHLFSPSGHALLASRYAYLGSGPLEILRNIVLHPLSLIKAHVLETEHRRYIRLLLAPAAYLPLLAPWVLVLAIPSVALNLLSSDRNMYLGVFQYNAEIVPILIFSTIEALVLIVWVVQWTQGRLRERQAQVKLAGGSGDIAACKQRNGSLASYRLSWFQPAVLLLLLCALLFSSLRVDQSYGVLPYSRGFAEPGVTAHDLLAQRFIDMIPASASVSAQDNLVPHISNRTNIYLFPYGVGAADYIFLDVTSNSVYPYDSSQYVSKVKSLLLHSNYGLIAAQDGYILLKRGLASPGLSPISPVVSGSDAIPKMPAAFCSFIHVPEQQVTAPMRVDFNLPDQADTDISLIGYHVALPDTFSIITRELQVTTYWRVGQTRLPWLKIETSLVDNNGKEMFASDDFSGLYWCPTTTWQPGSVIEMTTSVLYIGNVPDGPAHVTVALLPNNPASTTIDGKSEGLPFKIVQAPKMVNALPGKNILQLQTFTVSW